MFKPHYLFILLTTFLFFLYTCEDVDTTPPTISISSHYSGQSVGEIVVIKVSTDDNDGVKKVEFYVNDELEMTVTKSPFEFAWNTTELDDGDYVVKAIAYDNSGNSTETQPIMLTINNQSYKPSEIEIASIVFENGGFTITWKKSLDNDFQSYQLEKSVESQMLDYAVIHTTNNIDELFFFDTDVNPLAYYYYRITVFDTVGLEQKGQILSSSLDPAPNPVNIKSVTYTYIDMTVGWDKSTDSDFKEYRLLYSETQSGNKSIIDTYSDINTTAYLTTDFDPTQENWYWIEVEDTLGLTTIGTGKSNQRDPFPKQVNITSVVYDLTEMTVNWNISQDDDFLNYKLLYADAYNGIQDTILNISDKNIISHTITEFDPTIFNYYWIVVTDYYGQQTVGVGKANTIELPPLASLLNPIVYINGSFDISWTKNNDNDFVSYELFEANNSYMNNKSSIYYSNNSTDLSFIRNGISIGERRYYRLLTTDFWGLESISQVNQGSSFDRIVYSNSLHIIDSDGNNNKLLVDDVIGSGSYIFDVSPDGEKVVYAFREPDNTYIHLINIEGTNKISLTGTLSSTYYLRYSPDGQKIIFNDRNSHPNGDIWLMKPDGSNLTNVTKNNTSGCADASITPNGANIVYLEYQSSYTQKVHIMDIDGNNSKLISWDSFSQEHNPSISHSGNKIVFTSNRNGNTNAFTMDLDGQNKFQLTYLNDDSVDTPIYSPDDTKIAFSTGKGHLFIIDSDGSNLIDLGSGHLFNFSPDGNKIIFGADRNGTSGLYIMNIDGSDVQLIKDIFPGYAKYVRR